MSTDKNDSSPRILIVGSGIAGVSAAHFLHSNGLANVTILEARDRVGGRIHTIEYDGKPLDLGAEWIHGGSPANCASNLAIS